MCPFHPKYSPSVLESRGRDSWWNWQTKCYQHAPPTVIISDKVPKNKHWFPALELLVPALNPNKNKPQCGIPLSTRNTQNEFILYITIVNSTVCCPFRKVFVQDIRNNT